MNCCGIHLRRHTGENVSQDSIHCMGGWLANSSSSTLDLIFPKIFSNPITTNNHNKVYNTEPYDMKKQSTEYKEEKRIQLRRENTAYDIKKQDTEDK